MQGGGVTRLSVLPLRFSKEGQLPWAPVPSRPTSCSIYVTLGQIEKKEAKDRRTRLNCSSRARRAKQNQNRSFVLKSKRGGLFVRFWCGDPSQQRAGIRAAVAHNQKVRPFKSFAPLRSPRLKCTFGLIHLKVSCLVGPTSANKCHGNCECVAPPPHFCYFGYPGWASIGALLCVCAPLVLLPARTVSWHHTLPPGRTALNQFYIFH